MAQKKTKEANEAPGAFKKWVYLIWFARILDGIGGNIFQWVGGGGFVVEFFAFVLMSLYIFCYQHARKVDP